MDLRQLRYAFAVAEHFGFDRAARALGVSQSIVSRGVAHLEDDLGVTLFERTPSGVRITSAGRAVLQRAKRPYNELAEIEAFAGSAGRADVGSLAIAFYPDLSTGLLREILTRHCERWPDVMLHFVEDAPAGQLIALRERRVDVVFLSAADTAPGAESETLWDEGIFVAVPEGHRLAAAGETRWRDVRKERFLVRSYDTGPIVAAWLTACLGVSGYAPNIEQHEVGRSALFGLVACGYGLTPCSVSATGGRPPGVVFVPIVGALSTVPVRVAWMSENFNPALQRFLTHTREVVRRSRSIQA